MQGGLDWHGSTGASGPSRRAARGEHAMRGTSTACNALVISLDAMGQIVFCHPAEAQRLHRCVDDEGCVAFTQDSCKYEREQSQSHASKREQAIQDAAARAAWVQTQQLAAPEEYRFVVARYQHRLRLIDARQHAC